MDGVALPLGVAESEAVADIDRVKEGVMDCDVVPEALGVPVPVGVRVAVRVTDILGLTERDGVIDADADPVGVRERLWLWEDVRDWLGDSDDDVVEDGEEVSEAEPLDERLTLWEGVTDWLGERLAVTDAERVAVAVWLGLCDPLGVWDGPQRSLRATST